MEDEGQGDYQGGQEGGNAERRSRSRSPIRHRDSITEHDERPESDSGRGKRESKNGVSLYISGLATRTREADLIAKFSPYGKVVHVSIIKDPHSQVSRGFGFVAMGSEDEADQAISHMNRANLDGRNITVERARRPRPHSPTPGRYHGSKGMDVTRRDERFRPTERAVGTRYGYEDRYRADPDPYRRPYAADYDRGLPPVRSVYERGYSDLRGDRYDDRERYRLVDPLGRDPLGRDYRDTRDYAREYYARPASSMYLPASRDDRYGSLGLGPSSRYDSLAPPRSSAAYGGRRERSRSPYTYR